MSGPFPTGEQVYDRLRWDERFDLDRIHIVFSLRPSGTKVVPYREFDLTTIPWHRIVEYRLDGEAFWSRHDRIDRITELAARTGFRRTAGGGDVERVEPAALETSPLTSQRFDASRGAWGSGCSPWSRARRPLLVDTVVPAVRSSPPCPVTRRRAFFHAGVRSARRGVP